MEKRLYDTYEKIEDSHWWFVGRRAIISNILKDYPKGQKIFDFGCNTGNLAGRLQSEGFDVYGSDISDQALAFGMSKGVKNLEVGSIGNMPFKDKKFDTILALDVVEHIEDDVATLRELSSMLSANGRIIIMVPALPILWGVQDEVAHHFRRYTKSSLRSLVEKTDLKINRLTYFNFFLFPMIAGVRLAQRLLRPILKPKRTSDFDLNNPFINWLFTKMFGAEEYFLRFMNFPIGVSLLVILEKK